nr:MAG TPA: hypothetical protein [Caudoviricetes sp.]
MQQREVFLDGVMRSFSLLHPENIMLIILLIAKCIIFCRKSRRLIRLSGKRR